MSDILVIDTILQFVYFILEFYFENNNYSVRYTIPYASQR